MASVRPYLNIRNDALSYVEQQILYILKVKHKHKKYMMQPLNVQDHLNHRKEKGRVKGNLRVLKIVEKEIVK